MIERATYSAKEVATLFGVSLSAIYEATRRGLLPSLAVGVRRRIFPRAAILKLLQNGAHIDDNNSTHKKNAAPFEVGTAREDYCRDEDSAKTT